MQTALEILSKNRKQVIAAYRKYRTEWERMKYPKELKDFPIPE